MAITVTYFWLFLPPLVDLLVALRQQKRNFCLPKVSFLFIQTQANRRPKAGADSRSGLFLFYNCTPAFWRKPIALFLLWTCGEADGVKLPFITKLTSHHAPRGAGGVIGNRQTASCGRRELPCGRLRNGRSVYRFDGLLLSQKPYLNSRKEPTPPECLRQ